MSAVTDNLINHHHTQSGNTSCHSEYQRQSHTCDLRNLCENADANTLSPPWMKDLIVKKREKLLDIVSTVGKQEQYQLTSPSPSSSLPEGGKTSIGASCRPNPEAISGALSKHSYTSTNTSTGSSLPSQGDASLGSCESGFSRKKAVHLCDSPTLSPTLSNTNVIVPNAFRSVSRGLMCACSDPCTCDSNIQHHNSDLQVTKCNHHGHNQSMKVPTLTPNVVTNFGLIAVRKQQLVRRHISEPASNEHLKHSLTQRGFTSICTKCDNTELLQKIIMVDDDIKDDLSDYLDTGLNNYEMLIDNNRPNSVSSSIMDSSASSNGMIIDDGYDESEYEYGPGFVAKLKLKYMSISMQQQQKHCGHHIYSKIKRCSSLENISNDRIIYHPQHTFNNENRTFQANELLLQNSMGKHITIGSITEKGNRENGNGNHPLQRHYIQHYNNNNKNNYYSNSNKSSIVPVLKRAKSMETLLFQDDSEVRQTLNLCSHQQQHDICNQCNRQESIPDDNISNTSNIMMSNEKNVVVIENATSDSENKRIDDIIPIHLPIVNTTKSGNERDELPKPDTVKTCKRFFESTSLGVSQTENTTRAPSGTMSDTNESNKPKNNYKKVMSPTNGVKRKPPVIRATSKSASMKSAATLTSSPSPTGKLSQSSVFPLSTPSPIARSNVVNGNTNNITNKSANPVKPPIAPKRLSLASRNSSSSNSPTITPPIKTPRLRNAKQTNGMAQQPLKSNGDVNPNDSTKQENIIKYISSESLERIRASGTTMTFNGCKSSLIQLPLSLPQSSAVNLQNEQNSHQKNGESDNCLVNSPKISNKPIANIKPYNHSHNNDTSKTINGSINNQSKTESVCNDENNKSATITESIMDVESLVTNTDEKVNEQSTIIESVPSENKSEKVIENTRKISDENTPPSPHNQTKDETDYQTQTDHLDQKPQLVHDLPQSDVLKQSALLNVSKNNTANAITNRGGKSLSSSLWSQHGHKSPNSSTTVVFDFRGKDVKPNLSIQPTPFGFTSASTKRSSTNKSKDGSLINGSSADSDDDDDNYTGSMDIPPPSGIIFTGENVIVGKGSLLETRNKKLRIQFDDSTTSTYEYPSEASMMEDVPITPPLWSNAANGDVKSETNESVISSNASNPNTALSALKTNLALGGSSGGGLGCYKPTSLETIGTPFELGVSRVKKTMEKVVTNSNHAPAEVITPQDSDIKPADPNQTMSWSTSSTASDLLF